MDRVKLHEEICKQLNDIYRRKNSDYGNSFGETFEKLGIVSAVTRITDKVNRIQSLASAGYKKQNVYIKDILEFMKTLPETCNKQEIVDKICEIVASNSAQQVKDESIEDTLMDLANYAIMTLIEMRIGRGDYYGRKMRLTKEEFVEAVNKCTGCIRIKIQDLESGEKDIPATAYVDERCWCVAIRDDKSEYKGYDEYTYDKKWVAYI